MRTLEEKRAAPSDSTGSAVDWASWQPQQECVLCFVVTGGRVLLIRKKRGLGAGKVNGPGGKIDPGETAEQAAVRETQEELGVTPIGLQSAGMLSFQFADGYAMRCEVFRADGVEEEAIPVETAEAVPLWTGVEAVPYEEMWEDDRHWFPLMLSGEYFKGWFAFEEDRMQWMRIEVVQ